MESPAGQALKVAVTEHFEAFGPHEDCDVSTIIADLYDAGFKIIRARKPKA